MTNPDEPLREIRAHIIEYRAGEVGDPMDMLDCIIECFTELDKWLTDGNILPSAWGFAVPPLVIKMEE
jgi:hypothetical protein